MESLSFLQGENLFYILIVLSYLLGSIPIGLVYTKITGGTDPRTMGSGNIGATNMKRAAGKTAGIITLVGDIGKGSLVAFIAKTYLTDTKQVSIVCFAVFVGHLFSVFLKFKGGKGVATAIGIFAVITPVAAMLMAAVFGIILFLVRYVSLASVGAALSAPSFLSVLPWYRSFIVLSIIIAIFIFIKHWDNFQKITAGTEDKVGE